MDGVSASLYNNNIIGDNNNIDRIEEKYWNIWEKINATISCPVVRSSMVGTSICVETVSKKME